MEFSVSLASLMAGGIGGNSGESGGGGSALEQLLWTLV
jgi:hypothetical protein